MKPLHKKLLACGGSGLLFAAAHPISFPSLATTEGLVLNHGAQGILAWVALVPMLLALREERGWRLFGYTALTSFAYFGISLAWINVALIEFGHFPLIGSLVTFALLMIYVSAFWGLAFFLSFFLPRHRGPSLALSLPIVMTSFELLRNDLFSGFPWQNPAYSQWANLPLLQTVSVVGIYGLTFVLFLSNGVVATLILRMKDRAKHPFPALAFSLLVGLVAAGYAYGEWKLARNDEEDVAAPKLKAALIQGNINQDDKNNSYYYADQILEVYRGLSSQVPKDTELVIWPEAAFPFVINQGKTEIADTLRDLYPIRLPWYLLTGVDTYVPDTSSPDGMRYSNNSILIDRDLHTIGYDAKSHLVPFGEYVPLHDWLKIEKVVASVGLFYPGEPGEGLRLGKVRLGKLICYEGIFPEITRHYAKVGVDFLVNLTNDAWFGGSSAPFQHLHFYLFRAVEAHKSLLRATNTGFSAFIDPSGRIVQQSELFTRAAMVTKIPLHTDRSIYSVIGDTVAWLLFAFAALLIWRGVEDERCVRRHASPEAAAKSKAKKRR